MLHGGVIGRDQGLRHQAHDRNFHAGCGQFVLQRLRQQVADFALTGGAANIQRLAVHHVGGAFRAQQLRAHLRPVAVGDHQAVSQADEADDRLRRAAGVGQLLGNRSLFTARMRELPPTATSAVFDMMQDAVRSFALSCSPREFAIA